MSDRVLPHAALALPPPFPSPQGHCPGTPASSGAASQLRWGCWSITGRAGRPSATFSKGKAPCRQDTRWHGSLWSPGRVHAGCRRSEQAPAASLSAGGFGCCNGFPGAAAHPEHPAAAAPTHRRHWN